MTPSAQQLHRYGIVSVLSCLLVLGSAAAASAQLDGAEGLRNGVELAFGLGYSSGPEGDDLDLSSYGLRYRHRFNERWGIQGAFMVEDGFTFDDEDGRFLDLSARLTLVETDRLEFFTVFGGGVLIYRRPTFRFSSTDGLQVVGREDDEVLTAHVGLGLEVDLKERLYLRPDLLYRRHSNIFAPFDDDGLEATVALGYRF